MNTAEFLTISSAVVPDRDALVSGPSPEGRVTYAEMASRVNQLANALQLVKKIAFNQLKAHRLGLDVRDHNVRAQRLYDSEGFAREGVVRDYNEVDGRCESLVLMSILEHEYRDS